MAGTNVKVLDCAGLRALMSTILPAEWLAMTGLAPTLAATAPTLAASRTTSTAASRATSAASGSKTSAQTLSQWACTVCTLINPSSVSRCNACDTKRVPKTLDTEALTAAATPATSASKPSQARSGVGASASSTLSSATTSPASAALGHALSSDQWQTLAVGSIRARAWLTLFWAVIADMQARRLATPDEVIRAFADVALVPGSNGRLYAVARPDSPLLRLGDVPSVAVRDALGRGGCCDVDAEMGIPIDLRGHCVHPATPVGAVAALQHCARSMAACSGNIVLFSSSSDEDRQAVFGFLAGHHGYTLDQLAFIGTLPIVRVHVEVPAIGEARAQARAALLPETKVLFGIGCASIRATPLLRVKAKITCCARLGVHAC